MYIDNIGMKSGFFRNKYNRRKHNIVILIMLVALTIVLPIAGCGTASVKTKGEVTVTEAPTADLTEAPTSVPTVMSATLLTAAPTAVPTAAPTPEPTAVPTASPAATSAAASEEDEAYSCASPDGGYTASVKDCVIIEVRNSKGKKVTEFNVEDGSANAVMSLSWVNNSMICASSHVNPSTSYFCVYDVEQKKLLVEKYGGLFMFIEAGNYESLIYTEVPPHFSTGEHIEKILDIDDKVLYEAPENMIISGICPNYETGDLAILTEDIDEGNVYLTVLFKADNSEWSTQLDYSGNIECFRDGHIIIMNGSVISVIYPDSNLKVKYENVN